MSRKTSLERVLPKQTLPAELPGDDEEHWLEVNARPKEKPPSRLEETGSRWWE